MRSLLPLLVSLLLATGCGKEEVQEPVAVPAAPATPRNLVLITFDTTRADHLESYGYAAETSPNFTRLALQGTVFENAMSQAAVTPVAHASLFTGLDPYHHGLRVLHGLVGNQLPETHVTLAEIWGQQGGQSAAFVSAYPVTGAFGLEQGFEIFDANFPQADGEGVVGSGGTINTGLAQRRADETTDAALAWLRERPAEAPPFLLWVHYFDPHDPFLLPPPEFLEMFPPTEPGRPAELMAIYDAEIRFMDLQMGRLLQELILLGQWDQTAVAVVADHGEGLGDHDWWSHGILYQEQLRIPLLLRIPGVAEGSRVAPVVRGIDLMPTLLEATGILSSQWPSMDGKSLLGLMRGEEEPAPRLAYADSVNQLTYGRLDDPARTDPKNDRLYSLFDGTYKLIHHQLEPEKNEFYNLLEDPGELTNLASTGQERMAEMAALLAGLEAFSEIDHRDSPTSAEHREQLRALGYVE